MPAPSTKIEERVLVTRIGMHGDATGGFLDPVSNDTNRAGIAILIVYTQLHRAAGEYQGVLPGWTASELQSDAGTIPLGFKQQLIVDRARTSMASTAWPRLPIETGVKSSWFRVTFNIFATIST